MAGHTGDRSAVNDLRCSRCGGWPYQGHDMILHARVNGGVVSIYAAYHSGCHDRSGDNTVHEYMEARGRQEAEDVLRALGQDRRWRL